MISEDKVKDWWIFIEKSSSFCNNSGQNGETLCGRLNELAMFLKDLNEFMTVKSNPRSILLELPSVGKFLGSLVKNTIVQCSEEVVKALFRCLLSLASHAEDKIDSATRKTIYWAQSQIKHMVSPSTVCPASVLMIGDVIGGTATDLTQTISTKLVYSICRDIMKEDGIEWNPTINNCVPSLKHEGRNLRNLSQMCVPLFDQHLVTPLIESLLLVGNSSTDLIPSSNDEHFSYMECLSPTFLELVTEMTQQTQLNPNIPGCGYHNILSYDALVALWRRYQPSFESQVFRVVELAVLRYPETTVEQIKALYTCCHLGKACRNYTELHLAALQIIYSFIYSLPENPRLQYVLTAFKEVCGESGTP